MKKIYVFKDAQGEELAVEANSPVEAWDALSDHFGTNLTALKEMGIKRIQAVGKDVEIINREVA